jgi:hypothetical protein
MLGHVIQWVIKFLRTRIGGFGNRKGFNEGHYGVETA